MKSAEKIIVIGFICLYTLGASLVSLHRFWQYDAFWYDFGILDETIWKLSRFQLPVLANLKPPAGSLVWGDHFNPSVVLLTPLYWLTNRPEITLIAQAVVVGISAVVIYLIAQKVVVNPIVRMALVASYLGFVGMQNALYTDIHNIVFALLPLSLTFWAIYNHHWKLYWLFFLISLGFQENIAGLGVGLGFFLLLKKERNLKVGVATILLSFLYALFSTKLLMPALGGHRYSYQPAYPQNWSGWLTQFISPADPKLKTLFLTFASFGFIALFSLSTLPLVLEHYLERFVLNTAGTRWDLGFHYNVLIALIMTIGSIEVICKLQRKKFLAKLLPFWSVMTLLIVFFLHRFYLHGPLLLATHPVFYDQTSRARFHDVFLSQIPQDGGLIMTQNNLAAHLTHQEVVLLNLNYRKIIPKWIAIDLALGQNANNFYPLTVDQLTRLLDSLATDSAYKKYFAFGNQTIWEHY